LSLVGLNPSPAATGESHNITVDCLCCSEFAGIDGYVSTDQIFHNIHRYTCSYLAGAELHPSVVSAGTISRNHLFTDDHVGQRSYFWLTEQSNWWYFPHFKFTLTVISSQNLAASTACNVEQHQNPLPVACRSCFWNILVSSVVRPSRPIVLATKLSAGDSLSALATFNSPLLFHSSFRAWTCSLKPPTFQRVTRVKTCIKGMQPSHFSTWLEVPGMFLERTNMWSLHTREMRYHHKMACCMSLTRISRIPALSCQTSSTRSPCSTSPRSETSFVFGVHTGASFVRRERIWFNKDKYTACLQGCDQEKSMGKFSGEGVKRLLASKGL